MVGCISAADARASRRRIRKAGKPSTAPWGGHNRKIVARPRGKRSCDCGGLSGFRDGARSRIVKAVLMQPRGRNAARPHHGPSRNDARGMGGDDHEGQNAGFAVDEPERGYDKYAGLGWAERAEAVRMESYMTHKVRGTLGVHYSLYPEDRPITPMPRPQSRDDGRER